MQDDIWVLFDLDGTITDSAEGIINSVCYALEKYGREVEDKEQLKCFVGPPLQQQFQENFDDLTEHRRGGSQIKTAEHHRQLGEVQLVKFRCQKQQGKVQHMQYCRNGGTDGDDGNPASTFDFPCLGHKMLRQLGKTDQRRNDEYHYGQKAQIVYNIAP